MQHTHRALNNNQKEEKPAKRSELKDIQADIRLDIFYKQLEDNYE